MLHLYDHLGQTLAALSPGYRVKHCSVCPASCCNSGFLHDEEECFCILDQEGKCVQVLPARSIVARLDCACVDDACQHAVEFETNLHKDKMAGRVRSLPVSVSYP